MTNSGPSWSDSVLEEGSGREPGRLPRLIETALAAGAPADELLTGLKRLAARSGPEADRRPFLALDAAWDLLPIFGRDAVEILLPAARLLERLPEHEVHPEWLESAPFPESGVVYAGSLDEVLSAPDLRAAGESVARLLAVMQSNEAFFELLLETAARSSPPGLALVEADATVRAAAGKPWREIREIVFRLIDGLRKAELSPSSRGPAGEAPPSPFAAAFLAAAGRPEAIGPLLLYLTHAHQAERYCRARGRWVRVRIQETLRRWLPEIFAGQGETDGGGAGSPGRAGAAPPRTPEAPWTVDEKEGRALAALLESGEGEAAARSSARLLAAKSDCDPLFRWLALSPLKRLAEGDPEPILFLQGARWGVHLLGERRLPLLHRSVGDLARLCGPGAHSATPPAAGLP